MQVEVMLSSLPSSQRAIALTFEDPSQIMKVRERGSRGVCAVRDLCGWCCAVLSFVRHYETFLAKFASACCGNIHSLPIRQHVHQKEIFCLWNSLSSLIDDAQDIYRRVGRERGQRQIFFSFSFLFVQFLELFILFLCLLLRADEHGGLSCNTIDEM